MTAPVDAVAAVDVVDLEPPTIERDLAPGMTRSIARTDLPDEELTLVLLQYEGEEPVMRWFQFAHLAPDRRQYSRYFAELAVGICQRLRPSLERTKGLDRLLEAKDAIVRAAMV